MPQPMRETQGLVYSEMSPVRPPDHRHRKAKALIADGKRRDPDGDPMVNDMISYKRLQQSDDPQRELSIESFYHGIHEATRLYMGRHPRTELHLRCGVLADVAWDRISQVVPGCDQETMAAYELCYFDVRPHLENASFIVETVLSGVCPQTSLNMPKLTASSRYADLRLAIAYWGGWDDHLAFSEDPLGFNQDTEILLRKIGYRSELCKSVLASLAQKVTEDNASYIVEKLREAAQEHAREDQAAPSTTDDILHQLEELADSDPVRTAHEGELQAQREYCPVGE